MNAYLISPNQQQDGLSNTLRLTALLYFKEALRTETYEQCAEILEGAKECNVSPEDIQKLIQEHIVFLKDRDRKIVPYKRRKP